MATIDPRAVREQVARLARSEQFADSERLRRFLHFTVESTLSGGRERVKEYVLGREVFDRQEAYDPRLDPIVRVEARRLRSKLAEYYGGPGQADAIRIDYPKGRYLPEITVASSAAPRPHTVRARWALPAAAAVALLCAGAIFGFRAMRPPPIVAVVPMQWLGSTQEPLDPSGIAFAEALTGDLANQSTVRTLSWPVIEERRSGFTTYSRTVHTLGASRLILILSRRNVGNVNITVFVLDTQSGMKLRTLRYNNQPPTVAAQEALANNVVADLQRSRSLQ